MNIINNLLFISMFLLGTIIIPIFILPFSIINNLFLSNNSDYWSSIPKIIFYLYNIKINIVDSKPLIKEGYILANHRCWMDFMIDPYISKSSIFGRIEAFLVTSVGSFILHLDNRVIYFYKNRNDSSYLFSLIKKHYFKEGIFTKRILFYPEGKRNRYLSLTKNELKKHLKYGFLKEIYNEKKLPVQLLISSNKEECINEYILEAKYGVKIYSILSEPIYSYNFKNFEDFINEIINEWLTCYNKVYKKKIIY